MALTYQVDCKSARGKSRHRRIGAWLSIFSNSVKSFTGAVDTNIGSTGNLIAGTFWGAVKMTIQLGSTLDT